MTIMGSFEKAGFLSSWAERIGVKRTRAANTAWFNFVDDLNTTLVRSAYTGLSKAHGHNWDQKPVAVRLLLRTNESFQAVVLMAERGIIGPARAVVRTIVEDSLCAAALLDKPETVIKALRDDAHASTLRHANFISRESLGDNPEQLKLLREAITDMEKGAPIIWRNMAGLSTMTPQYLNYLRLSNDAVHTSATSLNRFVLRSPNGDGWSYKIGPGTQGEVAATLHRAALASMPVAIVVTQLLGDDENNLMLNKLSLRFKELPSGDTI